MRTLKEKIKENIKLYWTNITIYNEELPIFIKKAGYDFVVIDGLNSVFDSLDKAGKMIKLCNLIDLPVIYRSNDEDKLIKATDLGADGIAWMNVTCKEDVERIKDKLLFYPEGKRRPNPFTPLGQYGAEDFSAIKKKFNEEVILWVFIEENVKEIESIKEILSEGNMDLVYLGQYVNDKDPETISRCIALADIARKHSIGIVGFRYLFSKESYIKMEKQKFSLQEPNVIGISCDSKIISDAFKNSLQKVKEDNSY